jgi:hypothetical protein
VTAVLHTWTRDLRFHPHSSRRKYLFPVRVLSSLFRGKFLDALVRAHERGELDRGGADLAEHETFGQLKDALYRKDWVVYAKRPFAGPEQVFKYLGRYTHRVGISNRRLVSLDEHGVCFHTKDGKQVTIAPEEFIRRFLLHVLPDGYVKIRHYGLLASSNVRTKLEAAHRHLEREDTPREEKRADPTWQERLLALTGIDVTTCPRCGGHMIRQPLATSTLSLLPANPYAPAFMDSS